LYIAPALVTPASIAASVSFSTGILRNMGLHLAPSACGKLVHKSTEMGIVSANRRTLFRFGPRNAGDPDAGVNHGAMRFIRPAGAAGRSAMFFALKGQPDYGITTGRVAGLPVLMQVG
jgi:hypothetical protein